MAEQAARTRRRELDGRSFETVVDEAKRAWHDALSTLEIVRVGDGYTRAESTKLLVNVYTSLYRAALFPRNLAEIDEAGDEVHFSPYVDVADCAAHGARVRSGPISTDSGFWDAYRTVYPLLSLLFPHKLGELVQGWVNAYAEGGWLPNWASPGYRGSMVGTMGDVTLADAIAKGIPGFDRQKAYEAIRKDAYHAPEGGQGREVHTLGGAGGASMALDEA